MLKNRRAWLVTLALVLVAALGYVVLDRTVFDDEPAPKTTVHLPQDPIDSGKSETDRVRVYVDNSGPVVSVTVRTPKKPWTDSLDIDVNGVELPLSRKRWLASRPEGCTLSLDLDADSLLSRVSLPRRCVPDSGTITAKVTVDGGKMVTAKAKETERPNVLMIMVDDMRTDELQWMPNVQKYLAKKGATFANGFASFPLCCPARASVLTGLYPHNHGVWSHKPPWGFSSLDDHDTVPVWLQRAGYHTTYLGKYLNGYGNQPKPGETEGKSTDYCPPGWDLWRASIDGGLPPSNPDEGSTYRYYDTTLNDNCDGYVSLEHEYQTTAYDRLTRDQLKENAEEGRPFFSYVSFTAPHPGLPHEPDDPADMKTPARPKRIRGGFDELIKDAPGADWDDPDRSDRPKMFRKDHRDGLRGQLREDARQRAEALYVVDEAVKRIVKTLDAKASRRARSARTRSSRSTTPRPSPTWPTPTRTPTSTVSHCSTSRESATPPPATAGAASSSPRPCRHARRSANWRGPCPSAPGRPR
jgi:hypothetical protein